MSEQERVLFVHAHPDDESITTGGTLATLVDRGARVTVLTCTRGERGEVIPADLQFLLDNTEALAAHRETELAAAMGILGVTDHRFLGSENARWPEREPRRYVDSGMVWGADGAEAVDALDPASLAAADFGEVSADIAAVISELAPDVVVSYNARGGYGHPDHIRAAEAARRAADVYGVPFYAIEPDDLVSVATASLSVDVSAQRDRKRLALAAHRTQVHILPGGDEFALSNGVPHPIDMIERFRRVHPDRPAGTTPFAQQSLAIKIISSLLIFVIGLCIGAMLTVVHQLSVLIGAVEVPAGLITGLVIVAAFVTGLRLVFGTRTLAGAAALGIMVAVAVLSIRSTGGSVLVPDSVEGLVWSFGPTLIALIVVGWPRVHSRARDKIGVSTEVKGSLHK